MGDHPKPSKKELPVRPSPFADLFVSPYELDYGTKGASDRSIADTGLRIQIGDQPLCMDLRGLYKAKHKELPADLMILDRYDIWLVFYTIGAIYTYGPTSDVLALGHEMEAQEEQSLYIIDMLPQSSVRENKDVSVEAQWTVGVEGNVLLTRKPDNSLEPLLLMGGNVKIDLSGETNIVGQLSFTLLTPGVQTTGIGASRGEWCFHKGEKPLLGEQVMAQTLLVHRRAKELKIRVRGYALLKTGWTSFPAMYRTDWLPVTCFLDS